MDDILLICNLDNIEEFINILKSKLQLNIVASYNKHSINFLDFTLSICKGKYEIAPYSKKFPSLPIPSTITKRNIKMDKNIVLSQLLQIYRISTNNKLFNECINNYLKFLLHNSYHKRLRHIIFKFLLPIKLSTHKWTTSIPLCNLCKHQTKVNNINIIKIMYINKYYIAIKEPLQCKTKNIHIIYEKDDEFHMILVTSLHEHLHKENNKNINILPIGLLTENKIKNLIKKHKNIQYNDKENNLKKRILYPCRIHNIFKYSAHIYGVKTTNKKSKTIDSYFNKYKKLTSTNQSINE